MWPLLGWAPHVTELRSIFGGALHLVLLVHCMVSDAFVHGDQSWDQATKGTPGYPRRLNLPAGWPKCQKAAAWPTFREDGLLQKRPFGFRLSEMITFNIEQSRGQGREVLICSGTSYTGPICQSQSDLTLMRQQLLETPLCPADSNC